MNGGMSEALQPPKKRNVFNCLAEYFLNGVKIGKTENSFIEHEFRVDGLLKDGENVITVHIKSATVYADGMDHPLRTLFSINADSVFLRKPPHSFGWDIMPRILSGGIWRSGAA